VRDLLVDTDALAGRELLHGFQQRLPAGHLTGSQSHPAMLDGRLDHVSLIGEEVELTVLDEVGVSLSRRLIEREIGPYVAIAAIHREHEHVVVDTVVNPWFA